MIMLFFTAASIMADGNAVMADDNTVMADDNAVMADDNAGKINLNLATQEQLMAAGIKEEVAVSILELRKENDEFIDIEELMDADGMDGRALRKIKKHFYIKEVAGCKC